MPCQSGSGKLQEILLITALVVLVVSTPWILRAVQAAWRRPAYLVALTIWLVAVPIRSGAETQGSTHVTPADLGVVLLVGFVLTRFVMRTDTEAAKSWVVIPLVGMAFAIVLSAVFSQSASGAIGGIVRYVEIFVLIPLCSYLAIRDRRDLTLIMKSMLGLALLEGVVGVYQFLTGTGASIGSKNVRAVGTFGAYDVIAMSKVVAYGIIVGVAWSLSK